MKKTLIMTKKPKPTLIMTKKKIFKGNPKGRKIA